MPPNEFTNELSFTNRSEPKRDHYFQQFVCYCVYSLPREGVYQPVAQQWSYASQHLPYSHVYQAIYNSVSKTWIALRVTFMRCQAMKYMAWNGRVPGKWVWHNWVIILPPAWRDSGKYRKVSIRAVGVQTEIRTEHSSEQKSHAWAKLNGCNGTVSCIAAAVQ
jgi:hypothetical protein